MYSPEIIYKPGKENILADMLSRLFEDPRTQHKYATRAILIE